MSIFSKRLKSRLKELDLSSAAVARQFKPPMTRQSVSGWAKGKAEPDRETIERLAVILGTKAEWLAPHLYKFRQTEGLPLRGKIAAGVWHETVDNSDQETERRPVAPDTRYPIDAQYLLQVEGNSINVWAKHGSLITCVDCVKGATPPRPGDLVVVERRRGALTETTVKRLRNGAGGPELWPESTDPAHQEKLTLGVAKGDTVEIRAVVIWVSNPVPRGD